MGQEFETKDPSDNAVFGRNDATSAPPTDGLVHGTGVFGLTTSPGAAGIFGANNGPKGPPNQPSVGVQGNGADAGVSGFSDQGAGIRAHSNHANAVEGFAHDPNGNAMFAQHLATTAPTATDGFPHGYGILAVTTVPGAAGAFGANNSAKGAGVQGNGPGSGVKGPDSIGVSGFSDAGWGVFGNSNSGSGVLARSGAGHGLDTFSDKDIAVFAQGGTFSGVFNGAFVVNKSPNLNPDPNNPAKPIDGSIVINEGSLFVNKGDVILANADCAEDFAVSDGAQVEAGTVMVLSTNGRVCESSLPYDRCVVGVVSGAGSFKPGLVLDRRPGEEGRVPLGLVGKVYCKVDAKYGPVEVGDLLTTSSTPGHAMKASDPLKAFGAVLGKALHPLRTGREVIPILVALQ